MRGPALLAAVLAAALCGVAASADVEVRAARDGQVLAVSHPERLAGKLVALAESCSVSAARAPLSPDAWSDALREDSLVHVVFAAPRRLRLQAADNQAREERVVQEILVPLPRGSWPRQVLVKSGKEVVLLTKYAPGPLRELVLEDDLRLRAVSPYDSLVR